MMRCHHQLHHLVQAIKTKCTKMAIHRVVLVRLEVLLYHFIHNISSPLEDQAKSILCHLKHTGTMVTWAMTLYQKSLRTYSTISHPLLPQQPIGTMAVWYDKGWIHSFSRKGDMKSIDNTWSAGANVFIWIRIIIFTYTHTGTTLNCDIVHRNPLSYSFV